MISETKLEEIKKYASLFFTIEEISILVGIDIEELRREIHFGTSPINNSYWIGKLDSKVKLRETVKDAADKGDIEACQLMYFWMNEQTESE